MNNILIKYTPVLDEVVTFLRYTDIIKLQKLCKILHNDYYLEKSKIVALNELKQWIPEFNWDIENKFELHNWHCRFKFIPNAIEVMYKLEIVDLSYIKIRKIPKLFCNLKMITSLTLQGNNLKKVPSSIENLQWLHELRLDDNKIKYLPKSIGNLIHLECIGLHNNKLKRLPNTIVNCIALNRLFISDNKITKLPKNIGKLKELDQLSIDNNMIKLLPKSFCKLKCLVGLSLGFNPLIKLPKNIGKLRYLEFIDISHTNIKNIPKSFENLININTLIIDEKYISQLNVSKMNELEDFRIIT